MKPQTPKNQAPGTGANAPRPVPDVFPSVDDQMFKKPGMMKDMVDSARSDFAAITDTDIETAFANPETTITPGTPVKRMAEEGMDAVSIGSAAVEAASDDVAQHLKEVAKIDDEIREIEEDFRTRHGIDLGDESKNSIAKKARLWLMRRTGSPIDLDAFARYDDAKRMRKSQKMRKLSEEEIGYQSLALKDRATHGALTQLSKSLREMEQNFYDIHGMTVMRDESSDELHKRIEKVMKHSPHALGMLRTYLEAREQLARLEKSAGIEKE